MKKDYWNKEGNGMSEDEYELWFDKDLKRDDFLERDSEDK